MKKILLVAAFVLISTPSFAYNTRDYCVNFQLLLNRIKTENIKECEAKYNAILSGKSRNACRNRAKIVYDQIIQEKQECKPVYDKLDINPSKE